MRSSIFVSAAALAVASAQLLPSTTIDPFPQTVYLSQTNSLGVVTGGPAVVTTFPAQPTIVTTQPVPDNIPAVGTGLHTLTLAGTGSDFNGTRVVTVSANINTTVVLVPSTTASVAEPSGSGATRSGPMASGSRNATQTGPDATATATAGAAHNFNAAAGGLIGFGAFMAAFL